MPEEAVGIVHEVFARVGMGNSDGVATLYAEDATLHERGSVHHGREKIRAFYERVVTEHETRAIVCGVWSAEPSHAVLVEATRKDSNSILAIDVFNIDGGLIRSMRIHIGSTEPGWQLMSRRSSAEGA